VWRNSNRSVVIVTRRRVGLVTPKGCEWHELGGGEGSEEAWEKQVSAIVQRTGMIATLVLDNEFFVQSIIPWSDALLDTARATIFLHSFLEDEGATAVAPQTVAMQDAAFGAPRFFSAVPVQDSARLDATFGSQPKGATRCSTMVAALALARSCAPESQTVLVGSDDAPLMAVLTGRYVQRLVPLPGDRRPAETVALALQRARLIGQVVDARRPLAVLALGEEWQHAAENQPDVKLLAVERLGETDIAGAASLVAPEESVVIHGWKRSPRAAWAALAASVAVLAFAIHLIDAVDTAERDRASIRPQPVAPTPRMVMEEKQIDAVRRAVDELNAPYSQAFHVFVPRDKSAIEVLNVEFQPSAGVRRTRARVVADATSLLSMADYVKQLSSSPGVLDAELLKHEIGPGGVRKVRFAVELRLQAGPSEESRT
jgi:hypothetical protein